MNGRHNASLMAISGLLASAPLIRQGRTNQEPLALGGSKTPPTPGSAQSPNHPITQSPWRWCRNPIDNFVLARLRKAGLSPSPEADRYTLIRRVSLDLIGL